MKKIILGIATLSLLFGALFMFQRKSAEPRYSSFGNVLKNISSNGVTLEVEVVSTPEKIALGLSGRETLCDNCGMLFVFASGEDRRFWMKDMRFNLDMLWIMDDRVAYIARNVPYGKGTGEVVTPEEKADKVLELNAGTSDRLGIKVGDLFKF